jgi:hypothetical protein
MIAPIARIAARYIASALITYGAVSPADAALLQPEIALLVGAALGAITEGAYAFARRKGWTT